MVVDTSAIVAILRAEDEAEGFLLVLGHAPQVLMSAPTFLEAGLVMSNDPAPRGMQRLNILIEKLAIEVVPTGREEAAIGIAAHQLYGHGSGHPAKLNFGDCFSYALAIVSGEPLLFTGEDFTHTDVASVLSG